MKGSDFDFLSFKEHKEERLKQLVVRTHSGMSSLHFAAYLGFASDGQREDFFVRKERQ